LTPPDATFGDVFFIPDAPLLRGISVRLNQGGYLPVLADQKSGWILIEAPGKPASAVKPLPGVIFEISEQGQLCALWLKPRQVFDKQTASSVGRPH
jgi:hypothetical protein